MPGSSERCVQRPEPVLPVAAHKETHSQQVREHRSAILDFTQDYLKSTSLPFASRGVSVDEMRAQLRWPKITASHRI